MNVVDPCETFQVFGCGLPDFFGLNEDGDAFPGEELEEFDSGGIVQSGGRVGAEKRSKAVTIGQGRGTRAVGKNDQVPHLRRFTHRSGHGTTGRSE